MRKLMAMGSLFLCLSLICYMYAIPHSLVSLNMKHTCSVGLLREQSVRVEGNQDADQETCYWPSPRTLTTDQEYWQQRVQEWQLQTVRRRL